MWKEITIIAIVMLLLDTLYLACIGSSFSKMIKYIQGSPVQMRYFSVILCYCLLIFGLYYFIVKEKKTPIHAFLLGIVIYGVYDTTNYATIKNWKIHLAFIDTIWGGILFYLTTKILYRFV